MGIGLHKVDKSCPIFRAVIIIARFETRTATSLKMAVCCDVAPCSLSDTNRRFREDYCFIIKVMTMVMISGLRERKWTDMIQPL
jgi:hypothetical protein